jgi:hypothetical protein
MSFPKNETQQEVVEAWRTYLDSLEKSLVQMDEDIKEVSQMAKQCTDEWCEATEHVIDELSNSLFSISEPRFANEEDTKRLKALKRRVYDLYANYREVYQQKA